MRAMILAAGRGKRMRELTETTPKPLLKIGNRFLIEYSLIALAESGITDIVINVAYRREQIQQALGDGSRYGVCIHYSVEEEALETGGGIYQALPLLGDQPFLVISSDIVTHYSLAQLPRNSESLAHLVLVDNPSYHPKGDFSLRDGQVCVGGEPTFTFANMGVYHPELFANCQPGYFRLGEVLKTAIARQQVTGEHYTGFWHNIGTPEDLAVVSLESL